MLRHVLAQHRIYARLPAVTGGLEVRHHLRAIPHRYRHLGRALLWAELAAGAACIRGYAHRRATTLAYHNGITPISVTMGAVPAYAAAPPAT